MKKTIQQAVKMKIINNIKEEHINRTEWLNDNFTMKERARIDREVAIKIMIALVFYITVMWIFGRMI